MVSYAVAPAAADPARYHSAERIFDDHLPLHDGAAVVFSMRPPNVGLPPKEEMVHPILRPLVGNLSAAPGAWVDGKSITYCFEGQGGFAFDEASKLVEEVPLFILTKRDQEGQPQAMGTPWITGSGPLFAHREPAAPGGRPQ